MNKKFEFKNQYGYILGFYTANKHLYISIVYIYPKYRNLGWGKKLLNYIPKDAELQISPIPEDDGTFYSTKTQLLNFYSANGFRIDVDCFGNTIGIKL